MSRPTQDADESQSDFYLRSLAYIDGFEGRSYNFTIENPVTLAEYSVVQGELARASQDAPTEKRRRAAYDRGVADRSSAHGAKPHRVLDDEPVRPRLAVIGIALAVVGALGVGLWRALRR